MSNHTTPADIDAETCFTEHNGRRDPACESCNQRATLVHCLACDASFEDGRWFTAVGSTAPNGCDHEALVDDWSDEIVCEVVGCRDAITTVGRRRCTFHQRWLDAEECGAMYQRLVARAS